MTAPLDVLATAWRILGPLLPVAVDAIKRGVDEHTLTSSLIAVAQSTAVERVNARAGKATPTLVVMAVHLDDTEERLRAVGRDADARTVAGIAADLRADAPTSPLTIGRALLGK